MSDNESIASFDDDKPKEVKNETKNEPEVRYTKTGKIKKPATAIQLECMAKARAKGMEKRKELKAVRDKEKKLKAENLLIRKLELESKLMEQEKRKQHLFKNNGYKQGKEPKESNEVKMQKPRSSYASRQFIDHTEDEEEIKELEERLEKMRGRKKEKEITSESESEPEALPVIKKIHKKKIKSIVEVDSESESEEEDQNYKKLNQKKQSKNFPSPIKPTRSLSCDRSQDPEMLARLRNLFPNYNPN